jgi:hypothetical protein
MPKDTKMPRFRAGIISVGAVIMAVTIAVPVAAGVQSAQAPPTAPPTGPAAPPPSPADSPPSAPPVIEPPVHTFKDVASSDTHAEAIELLAALGWARGYSDGTYRPSVSVERGQMATFLARATSLPGSDGSSPFKDTAGSVHEPAIVAVAESGIASGYPDGSFRPQQSVTRGQMATFLARAFKLPRASTSSSFIDIRGNTHEAAIRAVEQAGVAGGYADGTFRPGAPVTRAQMATFLVRAAMTS